MTNYKQSEITGSAWTRCARIVIENPSAPGVPAVTFVEERVLEVDGELVTRPAGNLVEPFLVESVDDMPANVDEEFPLLDRETLQPTGKVMTYGDLYDALLSAYIYRGMKRDAEEVARTQDGEGESE